MKNTKQELIKIILHYRAIHRNGDLAKRHWLYMYTELNDLINSPLNESVNVTKNEDRKQARDRYMNSDESDDDFVPGEDHPLFGRFGI